MPAGVAGGDIVTRMSGVSLGSDGTMSEFCDVIRTQGNTGVMPVDVLRFVTSEVLRGQFNGEALSQAFSFADELKGESTLEGSSNTYAEYTVIEDDTGSMQVEVPIEWSDVDGAPYTDEEGLAITAGQRGTGFRRPRSDPGKLLRVGRGVSPNGLPPPRIL